MSNQMSSNVPSSIASILSQHSTPAAQLDALMPALGELFDCDRCFLYLRDPQTRLGRVPFCWVRTEQIPTVYDPDWKPEPESLTDEDPMFAAAVRTEPSIFVEDVEAAPPDLLNREFEHENFGHRALIHAHICHDRQLWGVLQPCLFGRSRQWTAADRQAVAQILDAMTPIVVSYITQQAPRPKTTESRY